MKNLPMKLTICRRTNASMKETKYDIVISVEDVNSGSEFLELKVDLEKFTLALTGLSSVDCIGTTSNRLNTVGKTAERLTIWSNALNLPHIDKKDVTNILEEKLAIEYEGWSLHSHQIGNSHYFDAELGYPIHLIKWS